MASFLKTAVSADLLTLWISRMAPTLQPYKLPKNGAPAFKTLSLSNFSRKTSRHSNSTIKTLTLSKKEEGAAEVLTTNLKTPACFKLIGMSRASEWSSSKKIILILHTRPLEAKLLGQIFTYFQRLPPK